MPTAARLTGRFDGDRRHRAERRLDRLGRHHYGDLLLHYTVDVKFGKADNPDRKTLTEFRALPSSDNPIVVFMGVKNDGKTAVFLVTADASTLGDGKCSPTTPSAPSST